jgi:hypothetical protein
MSANLACKPAEESKPYYEMAFEEYATTAHSRAVPKWSVLAIPPEKYSTTVLCQMGTAQLRVLAFLWGVKQDGSKDVVAERIIQRYQFRAKLSGETEQSLAKLPRKALVPIAKEAGVYHPWLNRDDLAKQLVQWRHSGRERVRIEIARARHESAIREAAKKGRYVPAQNLERYGLDAQGQYEPIIFGVPLSHAQQTAPEAVAAARNLPRDEFLFWIEKNKSYAAKLSFIEPGSLADGGALFWVLVQKAFTTPEIPPLFAGL